MKTITVISNDRDCIIKVIHRDTDPGVWVVRRWKKFMWFKKASRQWRDVWFTDGQQALVFAHEMKRRHDGYYGSRAGKEIFQYAEQ
jgi:hypothetical protein